MMLRRTMVSVLAALLVGVLLPTDASAAFRLHISDNYGFAVVVEDNGPGDDISDLSPDGDGEIFHNVFLPNAAGDGYAEVSVTLAYSKGGGFPLGPSEMRLSSFQLRSTDSVVLTLTLEDTDFTHGAPTEPGFPLTLTNSISGAFCGGQADANDENGDPIPGSGIPTACTSDTLAMLTATAYANAANLQVGAGGVIPGGTTATTPLMFPGSGMLPLPIAFSGTNTVDFEATDTEAEYSLYTQILVSFQGPGDVDFIQYTSTAIGDQGLRVAEPASLLLMVTGVLGLACAKRRRLPRRG